jgi:hypothetical protein
MGGMRPLRIALVAGLVLAAAALAGVARPEAATSAEEDAARGLTVSGSAAVRTVPDRASFTFGVQSEGRTASQALAANAAEARRMIDAIKGAGVAAADIQTTQVSLQPRTSDDGQTILGYTAVNSVIATIRDLDRTGAVIDAAVNAGANQVFGPGLTRSDQDALYRQALRAAFADARAKARELAEAAGASVGRPLAIQESGGPIPVLEARAADTVQATPIEPGTQEIQATVTVTFALS